MLIRKATPEQIAAALAAVNTAHDTTLHAGTSAYGNTGLLPVGRGWRLTLKLESSRDPFHRHGHRSDSRNVAYNDGCGKRMSYVCWHGHRAFMRALYRLAPDAIIRTGLATYRGADDFERTHQATAWGSDPARGIGSLVAPLAYSDACDCERGECPSRTPGRVADVEDFTPAAEPDTWTPHNTIRGPVVMPETVSDSGDGDTACFEKPEGVPALAWHEYNRKFNALLRGENQP